MTTSYTTRSSPSTSYGVERVGGAWLKDNSGNFITDVSGRRIVVRAKGGSLPLTTYSTRPTI